MILQPQNQTDVRPADHHAKLARQGTDEQWDDDYLEMYVDYLDRQADAWRNDPPAAPEGFQLIQCDATPRHWPTYTVVDHDFYEPACPMCQYDSISDAHDGCEHSHHRAWRRWRITHKALGFGYSLGVVKGHGWKQGSGCNGCAISIRFRGKSLYILGKRREWWSCILQRHHWPTEELIAFGMCSKCLPCVYCGSSEAWHDCSAEAAG